MLLHSILNMTNSKMEQYYKAKRCSVCEYSLPPTYIRCCDANVCSETCAHKRLFVIQIEDNKLQSPWYWRNKITDAEYRQTKRIYREELKKAEEKIKKEQEQEQEKEKEKYEKNHVEQAKIEQEIKTETNNQCRNFLQQHKILGGVSFSFSIFLIFIII